MKDRESGKVWARTRNHSPPIGTEISRGSCLTSRWHRGLRRGRFGLQARQEWPKQCGCGRAWSRSAWASLLRVGVFDVGSDRLVPLDHRRSALVARTSERGERALLDRGDQGRRRYRGCRVGAAPLCGSLASARARSVADKRPRMSDATFAHAYPPDPADRGAMLRKGIGALVAGGTLIAIGFGSLFWSSEVARYGVRFFVPGGLTLWRRRVVFAARVAS